LRANNAEKVRQIHSDGNGEAKLKDFFAFLVFSSRSAVSYCSEPISRTMPLLFTVQSNSLILLLIWAFASGELKAFDEPKAEPLMQSNTRQAPGQTISFSPAQAAGEVPIFPERTDTVYFVVAVSGGAKTWARSLARTLLEIGQPFTSPQGPPLRPIYVDLPASGR
jgi:hypothetical protein